MKYSGIARSETGARSLAPLAELGAPLGYLGRTIYLLLDAAMRFVAQVIWSLRGAIRRRRTMDRLAQLDDHILRDIGIDRSEIRYVARGNPQRRDPMAGWH